MNAAFTVVPMNLRVHFYSLSHLSCYPVAATAMNPTAIAYGRCYSEKLIDLGQNRNRMWNCRIANRLSAETIELVPIRQYKMHIVTLQSFKCEMFTVSKLDI